MSSLETFFLVSQGLLLNYIYIYIYFFLNYILNKTDDDLVKLRKKYILDDEVSFQTEGMDLFKKKKKQIHSGNPLVEKYNYTLFSHLTPKFILDGERCKGRKGQ